MLCFERAQNLLVFSGGYKVFYHSATMGMERGKQLPKESPAKLFKSKAQNSEEVEELIVIYQCDKCLEICFFLGGPLASCCRCQPIMSL